MKNIYVGNLPFQLTEDELREVFAQYGDVSAARIIRDRETQRSRGFGFVEMPNDEEASKAIEALNGYSLKGRFLRVNEAQPRSNRPRRFYG